MTNALPRHPAAATSPGWSPAPAAPSAPSPADEADLQGLIDNFNIFTGALANQSDNLATTIHLLAPTLKTAHTSLVSLDKSLPPLRTYAIELTPAVAELPGLISASKPWLAQVRPLLSGKEGGGAAKLLARIDAGPRRAPPRRARNWRCRSSTSSASARPRCWSRPRNQTIEDQFSTGGPNYREFFYDLANFAGAGQNFDGNGPYVRAQVGGGPLPGRQNQPDGNHDPAATGSTTPTRSNRPLGIQPQLGGQPRTRSRTCAATRTRCPTSTAASARSAPPALDRRVSP